MRSSDTAAPNNTATSASARTTQRADQVRAHEAVVARYEHLLSEARETSRDWERVFGAIEDPICVVDADYRLVFANAAYINLFGPTRVLGAQHYCFALAPDPTSHSGQRDRNGPCADCPLPETVRTRHAGFTQQVWPAPARFGEAPALRTYQRWTYPVVSSTGTVDRVVEVIKDVTEQEDMRRSVAQTAALREADRLKAELLGTVSHELRSPLTAIKGYAATLLRHERRLPREERREFLEAIAEASDRLEVIINRLLEMSQLETGGILPHFAPVDVAQVVHEALASAEQRALANEPGTYVFTLRMVDMPSATSRVPAPAAPVVEADARLLRDALDNLLENAVKYSPEGGHIEVSVGMRSVADANRLPITASESATAGAAEETQRATGGESSAVLEIVVRDSGMGIPAEHLGRVFERFHRVDTRLTREVDGLGLGLAICKRIVELHGGAIWAESAPGVGSAFHLALPLVRFGASSQVLDAVG